MNWLQRSKELLGFKRVLPADRRRWLEARFFRPAGWPGFGLACVQNVLRVREFIAGVCMPFVQSEYYKRHTDRSAQLGVGGQGIIVPVKKGVKPPWGRLKEVCVRSIIHRPVTFKAKEDWIHPDRCAELANAAAYRGALTDNEFLWLLCRPYILSAELDYVCRAALFEVVCGLVIGNESFKLCSGIKQHVKTNMYNKRTWYQTQLEAICPDVGMLGLLTSAMGKIARVPVDSARARELQTFLDTLCRALRLHGMTDTAIVDLLASTYGTEISIYYQMNPGFLKSPLPQTHLRNYKKNKSRVGGAQGSTVPTHGAPEYRDVNWLILIPHGTRWVRRCVKCSMAGLSDKGLKLGYRELDKFSHPVPTGPEKGMSREDMQKFYCKLHEKNDPYEPVLYQGLCFEENGVLTPVTDPVYDLAMYCPPEEYKEIVRKRFERSFEAVKKCKEAQDAERKAAGEASGPTVGADAGTGEAVTGNGNLVVQAGGDHERGGGSTTGQQP